MTVNFSQLLSRPTDTIKRPIPLPPGTYYGVVQRHEFGESQQKKTPYVRFHLGVSYAGEDVDQDLLNGVELNKKTLRRDYYLTEDALYRLKDFISSCGIEVEGTSLSAIIPQTTNAQVVIQVKQRTAEGSDEVFNDVGDLKGVQ